MGKTKSKEKEKTLNVIIETPKHSRNKYNFNKKLKVFELKKILPAGAMFPFDFGFIPATKAEDGDPLDVLVIMDEPAFPGCYVPCRLIGALKATQTEEQKTVENDRLIAVSISSRMYAGLLTVNDLDKNVRDEIEHFFTSYNEMEGKKFQPQGWCSVNEAKEIIKKAKDF